VDLLLSQDGGYDYVITRVKYDRASDQVRYYDDPSEQPRDVLVVDTKGAGAPDRDALVSDLKAIQFLHARPLRVDALRGAAQSGELLPAFVGSCYGEYELRSLFAPEPIVHDTNHCWAAPAFARLAPHVRRGPPIVRLAMDYFLSSFRGSPDEAYLKLTVALEGLAIEVLKVFGAQSGLSLGTLPASRRVEAAYQSVGLGFEGRLKAEASRWHAARHTGIARRADGASIVDQLAVLRTMLVALLLRSVGYHGSVIGYEQDERGLWRAADRAWWGDPSLSSDAITAKTGFLVT
jgi:hypothetical protein